MSKKTIIDVKNALINHKKKTFTVIVILALSLYLGSFISPNIYIEAEIKAVLDRDYNMFINNNDDIAKEKKTRENCRFVNYSFKLNRPLLVIRNIKIKRVSMDQYIDEYIFYNQLDDEVKTLGKYFISDTKYNYSEGLNIYIEGMTDEKVKDLLNDYIIEVTWKDLINREHKEYYRIIDYLE